MQPRKSDEVMLLSTLKNLPYSKFLITMLGNPDSPTYLAAYKKVFPKDKNLEPKQMYQNIQKYFFEK